MLENDAEDIMERIKTSVIMLEGMTRLKILESLEVQHHMCLFNTGWVISIIMSQRQTSLRSVLQYFIVLFYPPKNVKILGRCILNFSPS